MSDIETAKKLFFEGLDFFDSGDLRSAELKLLQAHGLAPDNAAVLTNLAVVLAKAGNFSEASVHVRKALAADDRNVEALVVLSTCCFHDRKFSEMLNINDRILDIEPGNSDAHNNRGLALVQLDRLAEAIESYDRAIALNPDHADYYVNRGNASRTLMNHIDALEDSERAITIAPASSAAWLGKANALLELKRQDDALAAYDTALSFKPDLAEAWLGRGTTLFSLNRDEEALPNLDKAIACKRDFADGYFNKALLKLSLGEYEEGWKLYEWRWKATAPKSQLRHFDKPLWLVERALGGKIILVHSEQGFGDVIQFCRYLSLFKDHDCKVIFETPKPLVSLMRTSFPAIDIVENGKPLPPFDVHCPLMSLPLAFKTTLDSIPADIPYLFPAEDKAKVWRERLARPIVDTRPRIGLVWSGNANFRNDISRRIPLEKFLPLLTNNAEWFALQKDIHPSDRDTLTDTSQIQLLSDSFTDFSDTAAAISSMDLVISIDTSGAHLAGALGKPVWILLPFQADFRWLREREDSPWYPTARLFRQTTEGEWSDVLGQLSDEIGRLTING